MTCCSLSATLSVFRGGYQKRAPDPHGHAPLGDDTCGRWMLVFAAADRDAVAR